MIHPDTTLRWVRDDIGYGVFATRAIPKGTVVWVLDELDQRLSSERVRALGRRYEEVLGRYAYLDSRGQRILCWDHARWINHSCDANVLSTGWDFDVAVRDVAAGEEITNDYGTLNLEESFRCCCGLPRCRGTIGPEDFDVLAPLWDERVRAVFPRVRLVPQPLWSWVAPKRAVSLASRHPETVPSVRNHCRGVPPAATAPRVAAPRA